MFGADKMPDQLKKLITRGIALTAILERIDSSCIDSWKFRAGVNELWKFDCADVESI